jgi:L-iditol 2-dehydrogenase
MSSSKSNVAAVLHGAKDLRIVGRFPVCLIQSSDRDRLVQTERTIAAPGPGEAQVAVKATGLCGSDLHYYIQCVFDSSSVAVLKAKPRSCSGRNGEYVLRDPMALGQ